MVLFLTAGSVWKSAAAESTKGCRAGYRLGLTADTYRRAAVGTITGEESNVTCEKGDRGFLIYWRPQMARAAHVAKRTLMLLPAIREMRQRATSWGGGQLHPLLRVSWLARPFHRGVNCAFPLTVQPNGGIVRCSIRPFGSVIGTFCISGFVPSCSRC